MTLCSGKWTGYVVRVGCCGEWARTRNTINPGREDAMFQKHKEKKLREQQLRESVAELRELVAGLPDDDGAISTDGLKEFMEFVTERRIDLDTVPDLRRDVRLGLAQGGLFL
jgi:hypothetical protein